MYNHAILNVFMLFKTGNPAVSGKPNRFLISYIITQDMAKLYRHLYTFHPVQLRNFTLQLLNFLCSCRMLPNHFILLFLHLQKAQLSQRDRATLRVIEYFDKLLKVIRNDTVA